MILSLFYNAQEVRRLLSYNSDADNTLNNYRRHETTSECPLRYLTKYGIQTHLEFKVPSKFMLINNEQFGFNFHSKPPEPFSQVIFK